ncbi:DNA-binding protein [Mucilaginibacter mali]|uniref:DNA-binding protein n=1 Tax=Mucilaginibacter mali TaxID=2740462 RepID=A0A7D4Q5G4_9SPHI|nr:glycosyl hydrolase [Mucilaginibacter mali]QKJ28531.1 DNA-binding protein [Mucilaginibacter mali]
MRKFVSVVIACLLGLAATAQVRGKVVSKDQLKQVFLHPPESAKPWVFWYWMYGAVTREGITADLQAMKQAGIGGAYLMPIKSVTNPSMISNPVAQLSPEWWAMVKFSMEEADRIGVKLAMHDCDGFALAGGPWIIPELSMQKVVTSKTIVTGGKLYIDTLAVPAHYKNYYKDIEVLAYPSLKDEGISSYDAKPKASISLPNTDVQYLAERGNKKSFSSADACSITLEFDKPFTSRSLIIHTTASNYQSERLLIEASDDGKTYRTITRLVPPRHGWQDGDAQITNAIPTTTAKYFRFVYDKTGSEPGAEDLDFAKWKPSLKISGIELLSEPKINQFESKTGEVWRVSQSTTASQLPDELCVPKDQIINITNKLSADGKLNWQVPAGQWTIMRIGHTSTGHTNATGGAGNGLECDKFNPEAARIQFENWFGEAIKHGGPELAKRVLKIFHVDSWECGSQNWSPVFAGEFKKRRGYDLLPYLPLMAGVPVGTVQESEKVLADMRETIAELLVANFYGTMAKLAHEKGCTFSAESVAPTMVSDGMLHYQLADIPMGEFWFRSPTHDKPNDMLDAISGGHIYGKNIIQAEAFTELRLLWDEHPGMLKTMADRNFALGFNRYVFHVGTHNPWLDRKPGMTLDGIGNFFQRDQTWWKPGKAWIDYIQRCQALLQQGHPVADIAVFTGEETPRRAVLPARLVSTLPGLFGEEKVKSEHERMANKGEPIMNMLEDASHSANMETADTFTDPLRGYTYDSMNKDALLRLATVKDGRIVLPGGASYGVLVVPGADAMNPTGKLSTAVKNKITSLKAQGIHIISGDKPYAAPTLDGWGIGRDVIAKDRDGTPTKDMVWAHRSGDGFDIYFISNQQASDRNIQLSLRGTSGAPELWDAVTGDINAVSSQLVNGRTNLSVQLAANGSVFVVMRKGNAHNVVAAKNIKPIQTLKTQWQVSFDPKWGGPVKPVTFDKLDDWSARSEEGIRYYSGRAVYQQTFNWSGNSANVWLDLAKVANMGQIFLNGVDCGVAWTYPYRVNISKALKPGTNKIIVQVTNTWANRLRGDHGKPEKEQLTWTNAPYRIETRQLLPAGLLGPVQLVKIE